MLLSDVMAIVFSVLGALIAFQGLWALCRALWFATVQQAAADLDRAIWKSFLVGLPVSVIAMLIIIAALKAGQAWGLVAIATLSIYTLFSASGVAGFATMIGARLTQTDLAGSNYKTTAVGGAAMQLASLLPLVGWFFILPFVAVLGTGATLRALLPKRKPKPAVAQSPPPIAGAGELQSGIVQ